jgi:iron complex outermembrane recepter protein
MQRFQKASLLAGTIMAGAMFAAPAYAQDTETADVSGSEETAESSAITVIGSRIRRADLESTSPVAVVSSEEFRLTGAVNVEQVLNTLPQVLPGVTGFSNNPGNGNVTFNLRNLGAVRTLVLVNGRRWMLADTNQLVDGNTIPQFLLNNVEVLTGGASAVYGTDAVSGVINFNLREVEGLELNGTYSLTGEGDGARYQFNAAIGSAFDDGRGAVTMYASYTQRDPIFQGARDFSARAAADGCLAPGTADAQGIGTRFTGPGGQAVFANIGGQQVLCGTGVREAGQLGYLPGGSATTPIATFITPADTFIFNPTGGGSRPFINPDDLYNFAPENYLQLGQERYLGGAYGRYEFTDGIEAYAEVSFVRNEVPTQLAPTPAGVSVPLFVNSPFFNDQTRALLNTNPVSTTPGATLGNPLYRQTQVNFRFNQLSGRISNFDRDAFRVLGGVRGDITDSLRFDAYYNYSRTTNTVLQRGNISASRYRNALTVEFVPGSTTALQCVDATARAQGCVPINAFGLGLADPAAIDYISVNATNVTTSELINAVGNINGELFNLGLGAEDVAFALGVEYRKVRAEFIPDEFLSSGDVLGFNAGTPTAGDYDVREVFGELRIPVLEDNVIHRLELNGAFRYSDYSLEAIGGTFTYNLGADLAPIEGLRFRGSYARAVRAPNTQDLFGGRATGFPGAIDPCSDRGPAATRTPELRAFCIQSGVPAANVFTTAVQPNAQIQADFGGNPNVLEETSDTWTVGAVIQPAFVPRLNITVDYFNIVIDGTIGQLGGGFGNAIGACFNTIRDPNNQICQPFFGTRNPVTGALGQNSGGQNPLIGSANVGKLENSGIDFQVDYSFPLLGGDLSLFYLGTWIDKLRNTPNLLFPTVVNINEGTFGNPEYRHNVRVSYQKGPALVSLRWRHEGSTQDFRINNTFVGTTRNVQDTGNFPTPFIEAYNYFDLALSLDVSEQLVLNAGVNNLFDKQPPILGTAQEQANTLPSFFDVLGRDFFVGVSFRF